MLLGLPLLLALALPAPQDPWLTDLDEACALAAEQGRDLLVDFTGSDWCSWCKKLDREVLSKALFTAPAAQHYVLVKVDLPRTAAGLRKVPNIARHRTLAREYSIKSFPTLLLMTAAGEPYARTGYQEGGAATYWLHIAALREQFRAPHVKALALAREFESAEPAARAKLAREALNVFRELPLTSVVLPRLVPLLGLFATLDPLDEKGDLGRALRALLPSGHATASQVALARELDPKNAKGLLELAVLAESYAARNERDRRRVALAIGALDRLGPIRDSQAAMVLYTNGALWSAQVLRDTEQAKRLARKALPYLSERPRLLGQVRRLLSP